MDTHKEVLKIANEAGVVGKKKFRDFINQKPTFIRKKTEEILF